MFDFGVLKTKKHFHPRAQWSVLKWHSMLRARFNKRIHRKKNNTLDKENPETRCAYWQLLDATTRQMSKVRRRAVPNFKWPDICLDAHTHTHHEVAGESIHTCWHLKGTASCAKKKLQEKNQFRNPKQISCRLPAAFFRLGDDQIMTFRCANRFVAPSRLFVNKVLQNFGNLSSFSDEVNSR